MGTISRFLTIAFLVSSFAFSQTTSGLNCAGTSVTPILHAEGVAERLGDIVLTCTSGTPGNIVGGNLTIFLNTPVTNKLTADGNLDVVLTVDNGSGPISAGVPAKLGGANQVIFNGLNFTVPAGGRVAFRISNLRGNVAALSTTQFPQALATLSFTAGQFIAIPNNSFSVGIPQRSLLATVLNTIVFRQQGSPLPEFTTFSGFRSAGTRFASVRVTEDPPNAFEKRQPMSDQGTRILLRYSNVPATARVFVPDVIAGSNTSQPTAAGDFGGTVSGGQYTQANTLLLVRVRGSDQHGAGGTLATTPTSSPNVFEAMSEIDFTAGMGIAAYEVVDSDVNTRESAQIPAFLSIPPVGDAALIQVRTEVLLAPLSTTANASQTAPVPRFNAVTPGNDCTVLGDCGGAFLPKLSVEFPSLDVTLPAGSPFVIRYGRVFNSGGSTLVWSADVVYKNGANWVTISPTGGVGQATIRVDFTPGALAPGVYEATLVVDAGQTAGSIQVPIKLTITPPQTQRPSITSVIHAATFAANPRLVRGSYATIKGSGFGTNPTVSVDGVNATVGFSNNEQINFIVPASLTPRASAQIVVTAGGQTSMPATVLLGSSAPGIFQPGILNQDNSVNTPTSPALTGTIIQIFATGVLPPEGGAVFVKIHDRENLVPLYAGAAPSIPGLQQINVRVPEDLPGITTEVVVCSEIQSQRTCSPPVRLDLRR